MPESDSQLLTNCLRAVRKARRKHGLTDESGHLPSADDQAQVVWERSNRLSRSGEAIRNPEAMLQKIANNVLNDDLRKLKTFRNAQDAVAHTEVVDSSDGGEAARQLSLLLEQLSPRERLTLEYYFQNEIEFPTNSRTVLDEHAADLQITKTALGKSLSRIREAARNLDTEVETPTAGSSTPAFSFNAGDFLSIKPTTDDSGHVLLTIGLPATLSEPDSRKAPERKLLEETIFRKLLPASVSYVLHGADRDESIDETLNTLRSAAAGLSATKFDMVRCQTLQMLARLLLDCGRHDSVDEILDDVRRLLASGVVQRSGIAVDLHEVLHELERRLADVRQHRPAARV